MSEGSFNDDFNDDFDIGVDATGGLPWPLPPVRVRVPSTPTYREVLVTAAPSLAFHSSGKATTRALTRPDPQPSVVAFNLSPPANSWAECRPAVQGTAAFISHPEVLPVLWDATVRGLMRQIEEERFAAQNAEEEMLLLGFTDERVYPPVDAITVIERPRTVTEARCAQCVERGRPSGKLLGHDLPLGARVYCSGCRELVEVS